MDELSSLAMLRQTRSLTQFTPATNNIVPDNAVERGWTIHFESGKMWGTFTRIRFMGKSREHRPRLGVWSFSRILFSSKESTNRHFWKVRIRYALILVGKSRHLEGKMIDSSAGCPWWLWTLFQGKWVSSLHCWEVSKMLWRLYPLVN